MHRIINIIAQCITVMNAELIHHHVTLVAYSPNAVSIQIMLYFTLSGFEHFACITFTVADDTMNKEIFKK